MTDAPTKPRGRLARRTTRRSGPCARALSLLAALVAVFATVIAGPLPAAHAMGNGDWSVDPYVPPGTDQNNRRYFYMDGAAGETLTDTAVVANSSDRPITLKLFGADAFNTPRDGAFSVKQFTDKMKGVGLWLKVANGQDTLTIQPQTRVAVPFTITIPADATPGDWVGGIMALNPDAIGQQTQGQLKVDLKMQVGARIYLNVKGPRMPAMDIRDVRVERDTGFTQFFGSSDAEVHYKVLNKGNVIIRPVTDLKATGIFGRTLLDKKHDPTKAGPEIFPGQEVELVVKWHDAPLLDRVNFKVSATSDSQDGQPLADSESVSYTAVPWPALLTLAILLIAGSVAWQLLRNRKRGGGKGGDPAEKSGPKGPAGDAEKTPGDADGGKTADKKAGKGKDAKTPAANAAETAPAAAPAAPAKPATAPAETPEPATTKAESTPSAKSGTPKVDTAKADNAKAGTAKSDTAKSDAPKVDTAKADTPKVDTGKSDAPKAADVAEGTTRPAVKTSDDDLPGSAADAGSADEAGDPAGVSR